MQSASHSDVHRYSLNSLGLILKKKTFNLPVYFNVMFSMEKISKINTESRNVSFDNFL